MTVTPPIDRSNLFRAPAPAVRPTPTSTRTTPRGYWRYFRTMQSNPLEVWTQAAFERDVIASRFLGRDYLFVHEPALIRQVFVTRHDDYALPPLRKSFLEPVLGEGLFLAEGDHWKALRRQLTPLFTPRHIGALGETMTTIAQARAKALLASSGEINMSAEMLRLTLDILVASLFSDEPSIDLAAFSQTLDQLLQENGLPHPLDLLGAPSALPRPGRARARALVGTLRAQMRVMIRARRKALAGGAELPDDFLSRLMAIGHETPDQPLSDSQIIDNLLTFFAAGHETTARTLAWAFYLLSEDQRIAAQVAEELIAARDVPARELLQAAPLTEAVLNETMRLYPAAAQINRVALHDGKLGDWDVKRGTEVFTSLWVLHRHRKLWTDPMLFDPSRFLGDAGKQFDRCQFLPFGIGPRVCIGAAFAMQEMAVILRAFLTRALPEPAGEDAPMPVMRITVQPDQPIRLGWTPVPQNG